MEITKGIEAIDLALYLEKEKTLIISDTQIGYEETLNKQGILIPRFQFQDLHGRLLKIIGKTNPSCIIINGDIKHEFGTISGSEWKNTLKLIDFLSSKAQLILIKGNHDTILGPIAEKKGLRVSDHYTLGKIYITHGHRLPEDEEFRKSNIVIIGHEHPAIGLRENGRNEKYKCFLKGKYKDKEIIVLPSFNLLTEGTDILSEKLMSPFLQQDIANFEIYVVDENTLYFGKVKDILKKL